MEMSFVEEGGQKVVLRGMTGNSARVVMAKRMEAIFRREELYTQRNVISQHGWMKEERCITHQRSKESLKSTRKCLG